MAHNNMRKPFISLVCAISLIFSLLGVPVAAADTNRVTASTNTSSRQGNYTYCYVDIGSLESLAALDVTVHYDPTVVKVIDVYNSVSCVLYDSVINADNIQFSYILDGKGAATQTGLFYFYYQVLSDAPVGNAYFDITIGEAYDSSLNDVAVSGSRCSFTITEKPVSKSCSIYGPSSASTSVEQTFTLDYTVSTCEIASGTAVITYDPELFQVENVQPGAFLDGKVVDMNTALPGAVYISFVGTQYSSSRAFASVTFKTIQNVTETSGIKFQAADFMDLQLIPYTCSGCNTGVNITFDSTYAGDAPAMKLDGSFSFEDMQVTLVVTLEANSRLGAGDFVITFDPTLVTYNSNEKGFDPTFFSINDKNVTDGQLKFSIISLEDIITEEKVLTIIFDVNPAYNRATADFTLDGKDLTDSLTESILLNFIDDSVWLDYLITFLHADGTVLQSQFYRLGDEVLPPEAPAKEADEYGTYTFIGWDSEVTACTGNTTYTAVFKRTYYTGNINGDSTIDYNDAIYLLLHTMFGEEPYPLNAAPGDIDGNGNVDQEDAVYLLLHTLFGEAFYPLSAKN